MIYGIEQVRPLVVQTVPDCYLGQDLALLYAQKQDYSTASDLFAEANARCPQDVDNSYGGGDLVGTIYRGLIDSYQAQGDSKAARQQASQLLALNAKDTKALATLTAVDLMQLFAAGMAQTNETTGVEPVQIRRFTMPQNGDWGDSLVHSSAQFSGL
ncbi:MAG: hypothetical protein M5U34_34430 [Chloroflexi bacterium]|nr:hypothetical protein [Chloroflexota bacterium]